MTVLALIEKRNQVWGSQKDAATLAIEESRDMNEDEKRSWDGFEKEYNTLTSQIKVQKTIEARDIEDTLANSDDISEDRKKEQKKVLSNDPKEAEQQRRSAFAGYLARGLQGMEDFEKSILKDYEPTYEGRAAQTKGTDSEGGFMVPEGFSGEIEVARAAFGGMRQAARIFKTPTGKNIPWPTVNDTSNVATLLAESGDATSGATNIVVAEKVLEAYKLSSDLLKATRELFEDEEIGAEAVINELLGERIGRKENALFTTGTGSSQPNGVVTAGASGKTGATGETTTTSRASILGLLHSVDPEYRSSPKTGYMFNDATLEAIKVLSIGSGDARPLWQPSMVQGEPATLEGYQYWINQDIASMAASSKSVLFGDFNMYIIRDVGSVLFRRLNERYAELDQFGIVAFARIDGELLDAGTKPIKFLTQASS